MGVRGAWRERGLSKQTLGDQEDERPTEPTRESRAAVARKPQRGGRLGRPRGGDPQRGQSQPNVPAVNRAYTRPSNTDFSVVPQFRLYQIDCCSSANE
jgi:hypothetical protein